MLHNWTEASRRVTGHVAEVISWRVEDTPLDTAFDEDEHDIPAMVNRINNYTDTHYVVRVQILVDNHVFGESQLGSCYAYDCTPEEDIANHVGGYLPQLIDEANQESLEAFGQTAKILAKLLAPTVDIPSTVVNLKDHVVIPR